MKERLLALIILRLVIHKMNNISPFNRICCLLRVKSNDSRVGFAIASHVIVSHGKQRKQDRISVAYCSINVSFSCLTYFDGLMTYLNN